MTREETHNVTNLTKKQRQQLFQEAINQTGFLSFTKTQKNKQTHYTFQYKN